MKRFYLLSALVALRFFAAIPTVAPFFLLDHLDNPREDDVFLYDLFLGGACASLFLSGLFMINSNGWRIEFPDMKDAGLLHGVLTFAGIAPLVFFCAGALGILSRYIAAPETSDFKTLNLPCLLMIANAVMGAFTIVNMLWCIKEEAQTLLRSQVKAQKKSD